MAQSWRHFLIIMCMLLRRDIYVLRTTFGTALIDSAVALGTELILAVHLLPLMGMPRFLIAPLFVGSIYARLFSLSNNNTIRLIYAIRAGGLPLYEAILPLPKYWLFARTIIRFSIELFLILFPLVISSIIFFGNDIGFDFVSWPSLCFFLTASSLFFGSLSIFLAHHYSFEWYLENGWARRLSIMFMTGVFFITWKTTMVCVPWFAYLALLNPTTYMVEGVRASLLDPQEYLPMAYCVVGTLFCCGFMIWAMGRSIIKRLDLV